MKLLKMLDENIEKWLIIFLLLNIVVWVFVQVIMRYIFSNSLSWSEEYVRWCFIWFIWVGVSYGFKTRKHISVTAALSLFPDRVVSVINIIASVIILWCMVSLFYYGVVQVINPIIARQNSIVLEWPLTDIQVGMQWLYSSLWVGALLSSLRLLQNIITDIKAFRSQKNDSSMNGQLINHKENH